MSLLLIGGSSILGLVALWVVFVRGATLWDRVSEISESLGMFGSQPEGARGASLCREIEQLRSLVTRINAESLDVYHRVKNLEGMLNEGTAIDLGIRECGWLIAVARVNNRDCVKIQKLHREMSMKEYDQLIEGLNYAGKHVSFIDGPHASAEFLSDRQAGRKPWELPMERSRLNWDWEGLDKPVKLG